MILVQTVPDIVREVPLILALLLALTAAFLDMFASGFLGLGAAGAKPKGKNEDEAAAMRHHAAPLKLMDIVEV